MSLFKYLRKRKSSANVAKDRLQIIISHERNQRSSPDYLPKMQEEILEVIAKYVKIDKEKVKVQLDKIGDNAILELNVTMPEDALEADSASRSAEVSDDVAEDKPKSKSKKKQKEPAEA